MLKVVLDTNTIISAFFWKGNEHDLFKKIEEKKIELYLSKEILDEIDEVLDRPKFKEVIENARLTKDQILNKIISISRLVFGPKLKINACRDPKDNKFLECGVIGKVDYIVSGDKDLLSIKEYKNIRIITSKDFLKIV